MYSDSELIKQCSVISLMITLLGTAHQVETAPSSLMSSKTVARTFSIVDYNYDMLQFGESKRKAKSTSH